MESYSHHKDKRTDHGASAGQRKEEPPARNNSNESAAGGGGGGTGGGDQWRPDPAAPGTRTGDHKTLDPFARTHDQKRTEPVSAESSRITSEACNPGSELGSSGVPPHPNPSVATGAAAAAADARQGKRLHNKNRVEPLNIASANAGRCQGGFGGGGGGGGGPSSFSPGRLPSPCWSPGMSDTTPVMKHHNNDEQKISDSSQASSYSASSYTSGARSNSLDSSASSIPSAPSVKRHTGKDSRWEAIQATNASSGPLGLSHFRLLKRLGYGDIGSVYLVELRGTGAFFAMKVMDKAALASRNKLLRAQTEREILGLLDHPFLPTLYSHFETDKFYCLVMEYCSGGNLHSLRQKQPNKYFTEQGARFYAAEVLLALEYLHMLGVVYRDLKPENVLVREEGHIMLSDFDLSLRCSVSPTLVKSSSVHTGCTGGSSTTAAMLDPDHAVQGCIQPSAFFPRILPKKNRKSKSDFGVSPSSSSNGGSGGGGLLEFMAEPSNARSMSFVGTHEYLAPEIIKGEGHGSAVDWWTFGIFLYELIHGTTPFKGQGNRATLLNVVGQPLKFPDSPVASSNAKELIRGLLIKDPLRRIAYRRGATEIKQHPFFEGVNWALVRCASPPHVPPAVDFSQYASKDSGGGMPPPTPGSGALPGGGGAAPAEKGRDGGGGKGGGKDKDDSYLDFEYF